MSLFFVLLFYCVILQGVSEKNALKGFLYPWHRLMPVVTIVLVKAIGEMLDEDDD